MRVDRQLLGQKWLQLSILCIFLGLSGCKVYTINKTALEQELKPEKGLKIGAIHKKTYKNSIDTLYCTDETGNLKIKCVNHDSKIVVVTKGNKAIKYYAKTLYIYKGQFLIGERTAPRLRGPNYFPVRLSEIDRIEVNAVSF
jgi:hypothetical protein